MEWHPDTPSPMADHSAPLSEQGYHHGAEDLEAHVVDVSHRTSAKQDPCTFDSMNDSAVTYENQGHYEKVEILFSQVIRSYEASKNEASQVMLQAVADLLAYTVHKGFGRRRRSYLLRW
jgi:hypothetical protein